MSILLLCIAMLIYFIPTIVAISNKKVNAGAIFALNLFLGWMVIGWVVALVWAVAKDQPASLDIKAFMDIKDAEFNKADKRRR